MQTYDIYFKLIGETEQGPEETQWILDKNNAGKPAFDLTKPEVDRWVNSYRNFKGVKTCVVFNGEHPDDPNV